MISVRFSPRALSDLVEITSHLAANAGLVVAERYDHDIRRQITGLSEFPEMGTPRPGLGKRVRMLVERPYLIFYTFDGETAEVLRILDGRRRITRKLVRGG